MNSATMEYFINFFLNIPTASVQVSAQVQSDAGGSCMPDVCLRLHKCLGTR